MHDEGSGAWAHAQSQQLELPDTYLAINLIEERLDHHFKQAAVLPIFKLYLYFWDTQHCDLISSGAG